jgi:putative acetyltransferase
MNTSSVELVYPQTWALIEAARDIFKEYAHSLKIDLSFQNFETELLDLPGCYAKPQGQLFLALVDGAVAGCGAFCPRFEVNYPNACEMRRLYGLPFGVLVWGVCSLKPCSMKPVKPVIR